MAELSAGNAAPAAAPLLAAAAGWAHDLAREGHEAASARGLAIAGLLEEIRAEPDIRAAAILYPLADSGAITTEAIETRFDAALRRRVEELQRLGSFGLPENWRAGVPLPPPQAETLRKMLLAIVADVRLVLVRLADQLDHLRLGFVHHRAVINVRDLRPRLDRAVVAKQPVEDLVGLHLEPHDLFSRERPRGALQRVLDRPLMEPGPAVLFHAAQHQQPDRHGSQLTRAVQAHAHGW